MSNIYRVTFTEKTYYEAVIVADSPEEVKSIIRSGEYCDPKCIGSDLEDIGAITFIREE